MKLSEIAKVAPIEVVADGEFHNLGFAKRRGTDLLMPLYSRRFKDVVLESPALACLLTTPELLDDMPDGLPVATSPDPLRHFFEIHMHLVDTPFYRDDQATTIDPSAEIHRTAHVDETGVQISAKTVIGPHSVVLAGTSIGADCRIGPNVTIGYEGFEIRDLGDRRLCIPHGGGVLIHDRVDIQANCSVAKSLFKDPTIIGADTKIGHMAFVSHGVVVGRRCKIAAGATISGSTVVGDDVWVGPNVQISNGLKIGDGAFLAIGAVVISDVESGTRVAGNFAVDMRKFKAFMASIQ